MVLRATGLPAAGRLQPVCLSSCHRDAFVGAAFTPPALSFRTSPDVFRRDAEESALAFSGAPCSFCERGAFLLECGRSTPL